MTLNQSKIFFFSAGSLLAEADSQQELRESLNKMVAAGWPGVLVAFWNIYGPVSVHESLFGRRPLGRLWQPEFFRYVVQSQRKKPFLTGFTSG